ncbi:MAG: sugar phosphate isomerase/epimerase family protein [Pirellulaceae bacterium]
MLLGYNTNGLAHHDPIDAVDLLADIGYRSVAITIDHGVLSPRDDRCLEQAHRLRDALQARGMRSVIETGARFLLDAREKHEPTLVSADPSGRARRVEFLRHAIDMARELGADCMSFWSGRLRDEVGAGIALDRLAGGLRQVIDYAADQDVMLGFEPEPGMFIDTTASFERLLQWIDAPHFCLTLDVGHLYCLHEVPIADYITRGGERIVNVHIEDMRAGVHEHLMFGEGEMSFPPIIEAFRQIDYRGGLHVELSRHSHEGPTAARRAYEFLSPLMGEV